MIELLISSRFDNRMAMMWLARIVAWLTDVLKDRADILLEGVLMMRDQPMHTTSILICEGESQKLIIELLKQPPGEFKDKYIASVILEDPGVYEVETAEEREKREKAIKDMESETSDEIICDSCPT